MKVLAFTGHAGAGKSTAAKMAKGILEAQGYRVEIFGFANKVREVAAELFQWDGDKTTFMDQHGINIDMTRGRGILVAVGEGMKGIDPQVWVKYMHSKILTDWHMHDHDESVYIIDDARFTVESSAFEDLPEGCDFHMINLHREENKLKEGPNELASPIGSELAIITNSGGEDQLFDSLHRVLTELEAPNAVS